MVIDDSDAGDIDEVGEDGNEDSYGVFGLRLRKDLYIDNSHGTLYNRHVYCYRKHE